MVILTAILSFFLGILSYRIYQARLIRMLPDQNKVTLRAFFSEIYLDGNKKEGPQSLVITIENKDEKALHLESWAIRALNQQGFLRQLFVSPQNLVITLKANEKYTLEVPEINFLKEHTLYTIVIRDIYGKEYQLSPDDIHHLRKDLFWHSIP